MLVWEVIVCGCRCMLQGCVSYYTCVYIACVFCVRVLGLIVCERMVVTIAIVYAFAFDCCNLVFHIARVFRLRFLFRVRAFVCLCVCVACVCDFMRLLVLLQVCVSYSIFVDCMCVLRSCLWSV